ncbi:MAG: PAS domain S-box protein, partial [Calditrichota bacterium]
MQIPQEISTEEFYLLYLSLENTPEAVFWLDAQARIYRVNEAACRLLGYSNPELLSLTFFDIDSNYTPAGWPDFHERIRREGMMVFESSHHHKNGTIIPVEVTTHWINLSGHDYICAFVRDITHHKPVRERLKEQGENPLELFLSQSLAGFFFMMLDHPVQWDNTIDKERCLDYVFEHQRITKVNDALLAQYGAKHTALTGMTPASLFLHDIPSGRRFWRKLFDNGCLHTEREERKLDGTPMWIEGDYICLYDNQGRITGHFGIQYDATERRRAAAQEAKLRAITEALPDLVFLVDEDGYYLEILTAESNLLYLNVEQLKGKRIQDVFP